MTMRRDVHDELRARLQEAAGAHEPDRERILARIERGMAEEARPERRAARPPVFGWLRVAGATAAVAGVLAAGGWAVASAVKEDTAQRTVATSPTPPSTPTSSPTSAPASTPSEEDGPFWSDGSVDPHSNEFWAQSNVTLKTGRHLTALEVELTVAQTGGVTSTGAWRSLPEDDFALTVAERDGFLVYTWRLRDGRTVPPGEWVFAGQYDHARGGRDAKDDGYSATARAGDEEFSVAGDFAPRS
ncbi:hypothetical protein [Streptomyces sp. YS415]|uniref:hypothetical protein n=1 Tax=Streptomyces sp. YS415 TaxID=2944806 RepID=UPI0020220A87|nr:hypothetical protein [Streptomyces sp. YS415]MCL7423965.1 hypothetical protein [Streptomyces sp. YS415]